MNKSNEVVASSTTRMLNDADVTLSSRLDATRLPGGLDSSLVVGYDQGIAEFLQKPTRIFTGNFSTSDTIASHLTTHQLPSALFSKALYLNKIKGFLGIRGKMVLRLQVNASPFQQGRLIMNYIPLANYSPEISAYRGDNLMRMTQTPNVQLDLATQTEAVLEIPYIAPTAYYDITTSSPEWGQATLSVYAPMRTGGGDTSCSLTIWLHMEDVEIVVPTIEPQAGKARKVKMNRRGGVKPPTEEEAEDATFKPVSGTLSVAASAASILGEIPMLSAIATPVSWVLDCASKVASIYGYSKPQQTAAATKVAQRVIPYAQNCDGADTSESLALSAENKVEVLPGFAGSNRDEMVIQHLVSIPAYYERVSWTTSTAVGTTLLTGSLEPFRFRSNSQITYGPTTYTYAAMTPMAMLATLFEYYRGSIVLTIKAAKTRFHSGRLVLVYVPWGKSTQPTVTFDSSDYAFREIIDMRESTEWEFEFPWASVLQWRKNGPNTYNAHGTPYDPYGYFYLMVETQLRCPDNASTTVELFFEYSGGSDMEFACPRPNYVTPYVTDDAPGLDENVIEVQSGTAGDTTSDLKPVHQAIATSMENTKQLDAVKYCIGERITSINQLLKRQSRVFLEGSYYSLDFDPNWIGCIQSVGGLISRQYMSGDYLSLFGSCFLFNRGSVRIRMYQLPAVSGNNCLARLHFSDATTPAVDSTLTIPYNGADIVYNDKTVDWMDFHVPAYSQYHTNFSQVSPTGVTQVFGPRARVNVPLSTSAPVNLDGTITYRSVGDDFQLGFFIGVPPMIIDITT